MEELNSITEKIIGAAYAVSNTLGSGFLEKVYENAMFLEILKSNLSVLKQYPLNVYYEDQIVGEYFADLIVEDQVIVEIKAIRELNEIHQAQLMNYLAACNKRCGLLINFGKPRIEIKRILNGF
ncbi:GxxExxY protein [Pedobacter roseus]|uniref:GxxExxY protein n=1 Tax=Pedobacter roseus TaxID=336820 RepID=A0A7G9QLE9_9SPHI|nr:GxxExxY protein [Pedobacter roseus]QNN44174.1 GxxExxY protein [Pedobacter roseus]